MIFSFNNFQLRRFFTIILTLDDCLEEEERIFAQEGQTVSLSKPNPFMLDAVVKRFKRSFTGLYYVGDMPDDMLAARRAKEKFKAIGFLLSAPDKAGLRKELKRAGADYIVEDLEDLKKILM